MNSGNDKEIKELWSEGMDPEKTDAVLSALDDLGAVDAPIGLKHRLKMEDTFKQNPSLPFSKIFAVALVPACLALLIVFLIPDNGPGPQSSDELTIEDSLTFLYGDQVEQDDLFTVQILDDELNYLEEVL